MQRVAVCLALAVLWCAGCTTLPPRPRSALVILISIDGFRWDYLQKHEAPTLRRLAAEGVHAQRMTPAFPSKTFPNHYTLATGLYPGHHGIVANDFFDPAFNESFAMSQPASNTEARWWAAGEPIWITAERQGVRTACYFWPGSEAENHGLRPSRYKPFERHYPSDKSVDELLSWLDVPSAERPRFCTLYFEAVDNAGHKFGPDASETATAVREVDAAIARLLSGLEQLGLRHATSLVIVSDHGMSETSTDRVIFLEDLMDLSQVQVESTGPVGGVRPKPSVDASKLLESIRAKAPPALHAFARSEVPARLHYDHGERISPVVLIADDHWTIERKSTWTTRRLTFYKASHGWDPATPNMGALFIAHGPSFRRAHEFPDVENIHVYNLLCVALGIKPAPNDGDDRLVGEALAR